MRRYAKIVALGVAVMLLSAAAAFADLDEIMDRGKIIVSIERAAPPYNFVDPASAQVTGFSTEMAKMYAEELDIEIEFKTFAFEGLIPSITAKKADMISASISRTIPRTVGILFTDMIIEAGSYGVIRKGEFQDIKSLEELNKPSVRVVMADGSIEQSIMKKRYPDSTHVVVPSGADMHAAVMAKRADIAWLSWPQPFAAVGAHPDRLDLLKDPQGKPIKLMVDTLGLVVSHDSFKLWRSLNLFLEMIRMDGRYDSLYQKFIVPYIEKSK